MKKYVEIAKKKCEQRIGDYYICIVFILISYYILI